MNAVHQMSHHQIVRIHMMLIQLLSIGVDKFAPFIKQSIPRWQSVRLAYEVESIGIKIQKLRFVQASINMTFHTVLSVYTLAQMSTS